MTAPPPVVQRRDRGLDGVRGVAVLLVVAGHFSVQWTHYIAPVGVTIFFVLSGYLITTLLVRERERRGRIDLKAFYIRRALRLYPALLLLVLLTPLILLIAGDVRLREFPEFGALAVTYLSDFAAAAGVDLGYFGHLWSLAVEEQFYLLWPATLIVLVLALRRRIPPVATVGALTVLAFVWRIVATFLLGPDRVYYAPDTNAFVLLIGCLLAVVPPTLLRRVPAWAAVVALVVVVASSFVFPFWSPEAQNWVVVLAALLSAVIVAGAVGARSLFSLAPLAWFGTISYSLYLWHNTLFNLRWHGGHDAQGLARIGLGALALGIAVLSYYCLERPLMARFKLRWERSSLPASPPAARGHGAVPSGSAAG